MLTLSSPTVAVMDCRGSEDQSLNLHMEINSLLFKSVCRYQNVLLGKGLFSSLPSLSETT